MSEEERLREILRKITRISMGPRPCTDDGWFAALQPVWALVEDGLGKAESSRIERECRDAMFLAIRVQERWDPRRWAAATTREDGRFARS